MLEGLIDVLFGWTLSYQPVVSIVLISFILSFLITVLYKFATDQKEMRRLKDELASYQKRMKELKGQPEKLLEVQKQAMAVNMKYMRNSIKVTLITFIPMILILGWMDARFSYEPLRPGEEFVVRAFVSGVDNVNITAPSDIAVSNRSASVVEGVAEFRLKADLGEYMVTLSSGGEEVDKSIIISQGREYAKVSEKYDGRVFDRVDLGNRPLKIFGLSWLWIYLISMLVFSVVLRRVLRVA